ncbi:MAG: baseplate J/gp47 family protein [Clostridiales bacterium]|jgi:phage-related baseplate assembly protein|nr:baseplate J/gp47 family protein [Clostridiales bacterium]
MPLPEIFFAEGDARALAAKLKKFYEAVRQASGEPSYSIGAADPMKLVQLSEAAILAQVNTDIDATGKGNLLYYAGDETIEHLGLLYGSRGARLRPCAAVTVVEYTLSTLRNVATVIPAGFRTTPDNKLFFATEEPLTIPAGEISGVVRASCLVAGTAGNGFAEGEIKNIVDRSPFVQSAVNITVSAGGADLEGLEEYRARIQLLPESFAVAGPDEAYKFWAKTANANIVDVAVWSPAPVEVNVVPLMKGGRAPEREVLDAVRAVLSDRTRRPLTDFVHVMPPRMTDYDVDFKYWIRASDAAQAAAIQLAVYQAAARFAEWQSEALGRDINPSVLHHMIMEAGVKRAVINAPVFTVLEHDQVGKAAAQTITYGGLEDD